jgi:hypothetical protein
LPTGSRRVFENAIVKPTRISFADPEDTREQLKVEWEDAATESTEALWVNDFFAVLPD